MKSYMAKYGAHYRTILKLGFPILLGQLGIIITGYADTMMVGQYSTASLASASFVNNVFTFVQMLCLGFSFGITPIVGSLFSQGRGDELGAQVKNALVANILYSILPLGAMLVLYVCIHHIGQPEELMPIIKPYFLLILVSNVPVVLVNVFRQATEAMNDTKLTMWVFTSGNVLNIILNYILIYGKLGAPELGLFGAGVSTLIARILMLVAYVVVLRRTRRYEALADSFAKSSWRVSEVLSISKMSLPVSLQLGMETGLWTAATIVVGWLGELHLAAYQVLLMLSTLGFMVYNSFAGAFAIKVANYNGTGDKESIRRSVHVGYVIILACAVVACCVFYFVGIPIIRVFTNDEAVVRLAYSIIFPLILYQFADATQITFANALRGIGAVMSMMKVAFFAYMVIGIPVCYLLGAAAGMGLDGVYLSFSVALFPAALLYYICFRKKLSKIHN